MLTAPEAVRDVFRGDASALHSGEGNEFLIPSVGPNSVLVLDDEPHARQRRILLPPLKGERMRSFFDAMQTATLEAVRAWPLGRPIRMLESMQQITLRVILQTVLGLKAGPQTRRNRAPGPANARAGSQPLYAHPREDSARRVAPKKPLAAFLSPDAQPE